MTEPVPLYGMCVISMPAMLTNISPARCDADPGPDEAKFNSRGLAFASAMSSLTDAAGSADGNIVLMRTAANLASLEMLNAYEWSQLTKQGTITVSSLLPPSPGEAVEQAYDLPEDFYRFIDQTQWNGAMRFPAVGPVSPQGWMTYMVFPISANFTLTWQMRQRTSEDKHLPRQHLGNRGAIVSRSARLHVDASSP